MRLRALAVFERVVHHCVVVDPERPERPVLEVDAVLREGDADGPLLVPVPTFMALCGGPGAAQGPLRLLNRAGRVVTHQGIAHLSFPIWERIDPDAPAGPGRPTPVP